MTRIPLRISHPIPDINIDEALNGDIDQKIRKLLDKLIRNISMYDCGALVINDISGDHISYPGELSVIRSFELDIPVLQVTIDGCGRILKSYISVKEPCGVIRVVKHVEIT